MKKDFSTAIAVLLLVWVAATLAPVTNRGDFDIASFGRIPVLADGRLKPLDTVARTGLLMIQGRQRVVTPAGSVEPVEWLLDVFYRPAQADTYAVFRIDHPDVLSIFGLGTGDSATGVRFSFAQLQGKLAELDRQADLAEPVEAAVRTPFQRAVIELREHVAYYSRLKFSAESPSSEDFSAEIGDPAKLAGDQAAVEAMRNFSFLRVIPPDLDSGRPDQWRSVGQFLLESAPASSARWVSLGRAKFYAALGKAWREQDSKGFNTMVSSYCQDLAANFPSAVRRCSWESYLNKVDPFSTSMALYVLAFLMALTLLFLFEQWRTSPRMRMQALLVALMLLLGSATGVSDIVRAFSHPAIKADLCNFPEAWHASEFSNLHMSTYLAETNAMPSVFRAQHPTIVVVRNQTGPCWHGSWYYPWD